MAFLRIFFWSVTSLWATPSSVPYLNDYLLLYKTAFNEVIELETKVDGLTEQTRKKINDRLREYPTKFKGKSVLIEDPNLLHAVITERKRLEKLKPLIEQLERSPGLASQLKEQLAADFFALEISNIILIYTGYLSDYQSGRRTSQVVLPPESMKIMAATLTALHFSKRRKQTMAFYHPLVLKSLKKEAAVALGVVLEGLGPQNEDLITEIRAEAPLKERKKLEKIRFLKTQELLNCIDKIGKMLLITNKSLWDEYQYHVIKAQREN